MHTAREAIKSHKKNLFQLEEKNKYVNKQFGQTIAKRITKF